MRNVAVLLMLVGGALLLMGDRLPIPGGEKSVEGVIHLIVVEEKDDRSPELAAILRNDDWRQGLSDRNVKLRVYDDDQPESVANGYTAKAIDSGLPAVILLDAAGSVLTADPMPTTTEGFDSMLRGFGR